MIRLRSQPWLKPFTPEHCCLSFSNRAHQRTRTPRPAYSRRSAVLGVLGNRPAFRAQGHCSSRSRRNPRCLGLALREAPIGPCASASSCPNRLCCLLRSRTDLGLCHIAICRQGHDPSRRRYCPRGDGCDCRLGSAPCLLDCWRRFDLRYYACPLHSAASARDCSRCLFSRWANLRSDPMARRNRHWSDGRGRRHSDGFAYGGSATRPPSWRNSRSTGPAGFMLLSTRFWQRRVPSSFSWTATSGCHRQLTAGSCCYWPPSPASGSGTNCTDRISETALRCFLSPSSQALLFAFSVIPAGITLDFARWYAWPLQASILIVAVMALWTLFEGSGVLRKAVLVGAAAVAAYWSLSVARTDAQIYYRIIGFRRCPAKPSRTCEMH